MLHDGRRRDGVTCMKKAGERYMTEEGWRMLMKEEGGCYMNEEEGRILRE